MLKTYLTCNDVCCVVSVICTIMLGLIIAVGTLLWSWTTFVAPNRCIVIGFKPHSWLYVSGLSIASLSAATVNTLCKWSSFRKPRVWGFFWCINLMFTSCFEFIVVIDNLYNLTTRLNSLSIETHLNRCFTKNARANEPVQGQSSWFFHWKKQNWITFISVRYRTCLANFRLWILTRHYIGFEPNQCQAAFRRGVGFC